MDLSNETIKNLFYRQIKELTLRTHDSFDLQFSGKLLEKEVVQMEDDLLQAALETWENNETTEEFDIYTEEGMENYVDDDGITPAEQGFMKGYLDA